ncbi:aspartate kinase [bacterium]|nr:aspartate kinase [candidate division CSSED10-310 bacterium]
MNIESSIRRKKPVIVKKFGGTTIGNSRLLPNIIHNIGRSLEEGYQVVVVVSAMGRKGDPYATETLLSLLPDDLNYSTSRERDLLMACGEIISAVFLASQLRKHGISSIARTGAEAGIVTDEEHGNARILGINPTQVMTDLSGIETVVIAGFQGISQSGCLTTLGRGGSDTSAVALACALHAETTEIYTDTDGIFSADPKTVPNARILNEIHAEDIRQMAWEGARVLHPRAAEIAASQKIHLQVKRIGGPEQGTVILPIVPVETRAVITAVASGAEVDQLTVALDASKYLEQSTRVYETVADAGVSMDMFTLVEQMVRFTIPVIHTQQIVTKLSKLGFKTIVRKHCSKVSIVGAGMHGIKGVMAKFARCLLNANVPVLQTVDSHATISALIPSHQVKSALIALHETFIEI